MNKNVRFKIFSEYDNNSLVELAVKRIDVSFAEISYVYPKRFVIDQNDIVILGLKENSDPLLTKAIDARSKYGTKFIIFTYSKDPVFIATLCRLEFTNIFILFYKKSSPKIPKKFYNKEN